MQAPETPSAFAAYVARYGTAHAEPRNCGFLVVRNGDDALAGVFNFSEIVRGAFQSAYLGYYAFAPLAGEGYMTEGFALALDFAFRRAGAASRRGERAAGQPSLARRSSNASASTREGYSRRYVKIGGRWRDHVRFAMLAEDWTKRRVELRRSLA